MNFEGIDVANHHNVRVEITQTVAWYTLLRASYSGLGTQITTFTTLFIYLFIYLFIFKYKLG